MALLQHIGRPVIEGDWTANLQGLQPELADRVHLFEIGQLATMALSFGELIKYGDIKGPKISDLGQAFSDLAQERQDKPFSAPTNKVRVRNGDLLLGLETNGKLTKDRQEVGELLYKVLGRDVDLPPVPNFSLRLGKMIDQSADARVDVVKLIRQEVRPQTVKLGLLGASLLLRQSGNVITL